MGFWGRKGLELRISALIPRLYAIALSWGCPRDICDDLIQETVTLVLVKHNQLRDPDAFDCWMIRILVNVHRQNLRKGKCLTTLEDDALVDDFGPANQFESSRTVDRVRKAIRLLSDEHRKVLVLVDMEGMSYREVANVLEIKMGTVMSRLGRARNNLRKILSEKNIHETQPTEKARANIRRIM